MVTYNIENNKIYLKFNQLRSCFLSLSATTERPEFIDREWHGYLALLQSIAFNSGTNYLANLVNTMVRHIILTENSNISPTPDDENDFTIDCVCSTFTKLIYMPSSVRLGWVPFRVSGQYSSNGIASGICIRILEIILLKYYKSHFIKIIYPYTHTCIH